MSKTPYVDEILAYKRKHAAEKEEERKAYEQRIREIQVEDMLKKGLDPYKKTEPPKKYCDHPNTMENSTATFFWIISMVVGAIFKGNWVIWIVATLIWLRFITRYD